MWIESDNRVYGRTLNAYDRRRTAGGSSGGEGAAIGCGGSVIGIGTDFAGSIRLPAFFNGVFGHKPSTRLVPMTGHFPISGGEAMRMSVAGPLARRATDLMPVLRLIAGPDGADPLVRDPPLGDPARAAARSLETEISATIEDGVLLHPPHPRVAPRHGWTVGRPWLLAPTALFNLLGMPATQVPLGLGRKGLPVGVQVAAGRDRDHVAIAVAIELERAFGGWVPPAPPT